jgi:hypothetical protein
MEGPFTIAAAAFASAPAAGATGWRVDQIDGRPADQLNDSHRVTNPPTAPTPPAYAPR